MPEVLRVVARLLQGPEDERREGLPATAGLLGVIGDTVCDLRRDPGRVTRTQMVGHGRRGNLEIRELRQQKLHSLWVGALMDTVEPVPLPAGEEPGHDLVRQDHELLHEHVRERLLLYPRPLDPALPVEDKRHLARLDPKRTAGKAPRAQCGRDALGQAKTAGQLLLRSLLPGEDPLRLSVGQPFPAPDQAPVDERLSDELEAPVEHRLDCHAASVEPGAKAAEVRGERVREHRLHAARYVHGEGALGRIPVERGSGRDVRRNIRDVHPGPDAVPLGAERERVVVILGSLGVDREGDEVAQVDTIGLVVARLLRKRRRGSADSLVPEEAFKHRLDVGGTAEDTLEARASPAQAHEDQVADRGVLGTFAVDDHRHAALEERRDRKELAAAGKLADEEGPVYDDSCFRSVRCAVRRASSTCVAGSSSALRPGRTPCPWRS